MAAAIALNGVTFTGCEQKEKIIDVKTPSKRIEVERSKGTGKVDVNVESRKRARTDAETPDAEVKAERSKGNGLPNVDVDADK